MIATTCRGNGMNDSKSRRVRRKIYRLPYYPENLIYRVFGFTFVNQFFSHANLHLKGLH